MQTNFFYATFVLKTFVLKTSMLPQHQQDTFEGQDL